MKKGLVHAEVSELQAHCYITVPSSQHDREYSTVLRSAGHMTRDLADVQISCVFANCKGRRIDTVCKRRHQSRVSFFPFFRSFPSSGKVFLVSAADR